MQVQQRERLTRSISITSNFRTALDDVRSGLVCFVITGCVRAEFVADFKQLILLAVLPHILRLNF
jgi:hypothetical protein